MSDFAVKLQVAQALADAMATDGLDGFLRWWVIDSAPPQRFADVCRPFQIDRMRKISGALEQVAGIRDYTGPRAFWNIASRGYDKSGSIARMVAWAVSYSRFPMEIVVAAGDQDQASILYDAAKRECELNPWIRGRIRFKTKKIEGIRSGSVVKILTADAPSSYGLRPDLIICDELTWWEKRDLWDAIFTARQKRPKCVMVVISNAGMLRTWQHDLYMGAKGDPSWVVWETDPRTNPTWMNREAIEQDAKLLPKSVAKRLYYNQWIDPSEEAGYLLRSEISACLRQGMEAHKEQQEGCTYALSIDYGPRKDRTCLSVLHQDRDALFYIDECKVIQGTYDNPVRIAEVENWIENKLEAFPQAGLIVDPYQLEGTIQRFGDRCSVTRYQARGPVGNYHMAELLRTSVLGQRLLWPPGIGAHPNRVEDDFAEELCNLIIKQLPSGKYRFDHESGMHDDRAVAVGMALLALHEGYIPRSHLVPEPLKLVRRSESGGIFSGFDRRPLFGISKADKRSK
jgi:hypothetical protein